MRAAIGLIGFLFTLSAQAAGPRFSQALNDADLQKVLQHVYTEPGALPELKAGEKKFPLKHTHAAVDIIGDVARVEVTQTYGNPFEQPLEAIYVFPLPENAAVDGMKMTIGERVVEADIQEREKARRTYEAAKNQGHTAALLEQERPNIFTQSVANIAPHTDVKVTTRYLQPLSYDAGWYELVFPMVVGPRFIPGEPIGKQGTGRLADTTLVPDASRITPSYVGPGERSGHDISLALTARTGLPIVEYEVPTHDVIYLPTLDGTLELELSPKDNLPNRDFVLRYRVDGKEIETAALAHHSRDKGGFVSVVVAPPHLDLDKLVGQREFIFVVDVSGSMSGLPLSMCQDAMREALRRMRPIDTFNVITFAGSTSKLFNTSRPANETNLAQAQELIQGLKAGGGTMLGDGVKEALATNGEAGRHRYVFFMTDGYVGNEPQILVDTKKYVNAFGTGSSRARVFGFGVGSSVNRMLLDGLGKEGDGLTVYATTREDPVDGVNKFYRYVDRSILENVEIDWGGLDVSEMLPAKLPDLFASKPMVVRARYTRGGKATIHIKGKAQGKLFDLPLEVDLPTTGATQPALATLWARSKAETYERDAWSGESTETKQKLTQLGLDFGIVTRYTSLVAVDRSSRVDGKSRTINQPLEAPEGVDLAQAGGYAAQHKGYGSLGLRGTGMGGGGYGSGSGSIGASPGVMAKLGKLIAPKKEAVAIAEPEVSDEGRWAKSAPSTSARALSDDRATREETRKPKDADKRDISRTDGVARPDSEASPLSTWIASHRAETRQCFEQFPQLAQISFVWFASADGKLLQLKATGAERGTPAEACFIKMMSAWRMNGEAAPRRYQWTFTR